MHEDIVNRAAAEVLCQRVVAAQGGTARPVLSCLCGPDAFAPALGAPVAPRLAGLYGGGCGRECR
jgi:hypothetical protein